MPNRPIHIMIDDKIVSVTTLYRDPSTAKRRYCEKNDIGGKQALQVSACYAPVKVPLAGRVQ